MKPILITGANGQLGTCIRKRLGGRPAICVDYEDLDISDENAVKKFFQQYEIGTIINCAAYTAVDQAEDDLNAAMKTNVVGPMLLSKYGRRIIHISTDYVFDGAARKPYNENSMTNPLSVYGTTKFTGERAVLKYAEAAAVIRTSWLYSEYGNNFVKTMQRLGAERKTLDVVCDQIGTPTYAGDLADVILKIADEIPADFREIYHYSNEGECSWYDFARAIMEISELKCKVKSIKSKNYPQKAARPQYSVLSKSKIKSQFDIVIPHWRDSLVKCIQKGKIK